MVGLTSTEVSRRIWQGPSAVNFGQFGDG